MDHADEDTEESIQIKDFNRKIKVNENDLIPIDDIVEETYAITYKNLLEQIKKDTFYEGLEYFKKVIREIISRELLEYESHIEKMYLKIICKLIGLKTEPNSIDFSALFNKIKETLIQNLNQSGHNVQLSKISVYNPNKRDFELVEFQTLIDNLKEVFAESTTLEELKEYASITFARIDDFQRVNNSLSQVYVKKNELHKDLNLAMSFIRPQTEQDLSLEFIAFHPKANSLYRLTSHKYLKGIPHGFQHWGAQASTDVYYSYHEFSNKMLRIDIRSDKVELRFPRNLKEKCIYLNIFLNITSMTNANDTMTKKLNVRFSENSNASQYASLFFYSGRQHNITMPILAGWYQVKYAIYNDDINQDVPHLLKI